MVVVEEGVEKDAAGGVPGDGDGGEREGGGAVTEGGVPAEAVPGGCPGQWGGRCPGETGGRRGADVFRAACRVICEHQMLRISLDDNRHAAGGMRPGYRAITGATVRAQLACGSWEEDVSR